MNLEKSVFFRIPEFFDKMSLLNSQRTRELLDELVYKT